MRSPVLPTRRWPAVAQVPCLAAMICLAGCSVHAQQAVDATVSPDGDLMVFRGERGQALTISMDRGGVWNAVLEGRGERVATTSRNCPGFASAMEAFRTLPGIKPGPYASQGAPDVRPIPPTTMDGESWTLTAPGFAPDWSPVVVMIEGDQGPYARWASSTVRTIRTCESE